MKNQIIAGHAGDVQFRTTTLPKGAKKIQNTPLAYGETSGHVHVLTGDVEMYEYEGTMLAVVGSDGAFLQHCHESVYKTNVATNAPLPIADHKPVQLAAGVYSFGIHKRYNPFSQVFENVID